MITTTTREKIKKKFGTLTAFYKATGLSQYDVNRKSAIQIASLVAKTEATRSPLLIPLYKIEMLKAAVMACGGVIAFCRENPEFSDRTVFQLLQGRKKRMSPVVVKLFKRFGI